MNKKLLVLTAFSALLVAGCNNNPTPTPTPGPDPVVVKVQDIFVRPVLSLAKGEEELLSVTVTPDAYEHKEVTWTSDDESVATVDENGKVTAISEGQAKIKATLVADPKFTTTCTVTVTDVEALATKVKSLGDKLELEVTIKKGTKGKDDQKLTSDYTYTIVQNEKYTYSDETKNGFGLIGGEEGAYYHIFEKDDAFDSDWGKAYLDEEEYIEKHVITSLADRFVETAPAYVENQKYFFINDDFLTDVAWILQLDEVLSSKETFGSVEIEENANGEVIMTLYRSVSGYTEIGSVKIKAKQDAAIGRVDEFLTTAEAKRTTVNPNEILYNLFYEKGSYTSETDLSEGEENMDLKEHEYVSANGFTSARDTEDWDLSDYYEYKYTQSYLFIDDHKDQKYGVYAVKSEIEGSEVYAIVDSDPEVIAERIEDGTAKLSYEGSDTYAFWYDVKGNNPRAVAYNNENLFDVERYGHNGQYYSMGLGYEYEVFEPDYTISKHTVDDTLLTNVADAYGLINLYDSSSPDYSGYIVDEWNDLQLYVHYSEENAEEVDKIELGFDCMMHYRDTDGKMPVDGNVGHYTGTKSFYDFSTEKDKYFKAIFPDVNEVPGQYYLIDGEDRIPVETVRIAVGETFKFDFKIDSSYKRYSQTVSENLKYDDKNKTITGVSAGVGQYIRTPNKNASDYVLEVIVVNGVEGKWLGKFLGEQLSLIADENSVKFCDKDATVTPTPDTLGEYDMVVDESLGFKDNAAHLYATGNGFELTFSMDKEDGTHNYFIILKDGDTVKAAKALIEEMASLFGMTSKDIVDESKEGFYQYELPLMADASKLSIADAKEMTADEIAPAINLELEEDWAEVEVELEDGTKLQGEHAFYLSDDGLVRVEFTIYQSTSQGTNVTNYIIDTYPSDQVLTPAE